MEKIKQESTEYARIEGVGVVVLAKPNERMTLNQAINAKSYQAGLPTRYFRLREGYWINEYMKSFISMCNIRRKEYKECPNISGYTQPSCF